MIVAKEGIKSAADLKGKTFGTFQADTLEVLPYDYLKKAGLTFKEVQIKYLDTSPELAQAFMAGAVLVAHAPGDHVAHGLEAAVRMAGKAGAVVFRVVGGEVVQHQERVQALLQILREHAGQLDAGAIAGWLTGDEAFDAAGLGNGGSHVGGLALKRVS